MENISNVRDILRQFMFILRVLQNFQLKYLILKRVRHLDGQSLCGKYVNFYLTTWKINTTNKVQKSYNV